MDWNSKATWDLTEFVEEAIPKIEAVDGSINFKGSGKKGDFSVDLKLGQVGNSGKELMDKWKEPGDFKMESSQSGSSKRARATSNGNQTVSCLVDGCDSDLSNCRDYHRRHKVCELHSKTPQVMIGGQKQRFCQQCSRFHSLEEFDEVKRSCRKRLDGHNRRRRKPQPDPLSRTGTYLSSYQGTQMLPFSSSHVNPSTTVVKTSWAGKADADGRHFEREQQLQSAEGRNLFLGSSPSSYTSGGKQFTFLQADNTSTLHNQTSAQASVRQHLLRTVPFSETGGGNLNMFCDRLTTTAPIRDSDCALSLLSSPQTQTSGISLSNMVQPSTIPLVQSLGPSLQNHVVAPMDSVVVANGRGAAANCTGMFQMGSDGSSANDQGPQTLPFHWE